MFTPFDQLLSYMNNILIDKDMKKWVNYTFFIKSVALPLKMLHQVTGDLILSLLLKKYGYSLYFTDMLFQYRQFSATRANRERMNINISLMEG